MSSAIDKSNRTFSVSVPPAPPELAALPEGSDSGYQLGKASHGAGAADSGMPVLSSGLIKQSDLSCTNWGLWWADLGSPTAPRLHGSIQRARIERLP